MSDHAFLAIDLTSEERHSLSAALHDASPGPPMPGRRTSPENWHITLRFLGECSDAQADQILHSLDGSIEGEQGRVWCDGLGAFPRMSQAGVIYGVIDDTSEMLGYLAAVCDEAAIGAGFEPEGRPYVPHLTLSRLRPARDVRSLLSGYGEFRVPIAVRGVTLLRTRRVPNGLRYEVIDSLPLPRSPGHRHRI